VAGKNDAICILQIHFPKSEFMELGTGFIVSDHMIVTAAHCVYKDDWADYVGVTVGGVNGAPLSAKRLLAVKGWVAGGAARPDYDYGAICVSNDLSKLPQVGLEAPSDTQLTAIKAVIAGFPFEQPNKTPCSTDPPRAVVDKTALRVIHDITTNASNKSPPGGMSGSPMTDQGKAFAIHSDGGCPNSGTRITPVRKDKIEKEWRQISVN
jgi:V8-like Glu-specific endopeptidase